jgi:ribosomal protein S14
VFKKEWARDIRFRKRLNTIEIPNKLGRYLRANLNSIENVKHIFVLNRKMSRYGVSLPTKRCIITGRSRGLVGDFALTRHKFKQLIEQGKITGITKSSW